MGNVIYRFTLILLLNCFFCLPSFAQHELSEKDAKSITAIKETYRTSWLNNDSKTILSLFAGDAVIYPNGMAPRKGIEAISEFWFAPTASKTVIEEYNIAVEKIIGEKMLAIATGSSEIKWSITNSRQNEKKRYSSTGNFLTVFSKETGGWKIIKHIWNGKSEEIKE